MRAAKLQKRAASVGFDWAETAAVVAKLKEEIVELEAEIASGNTQGIDEELGDVLFSCVNLARHLMVDPEEQCIPLKFSQLVIQFESINLDTIQQLASCLIILMRLY